MKTIALVNPASGGVTADGAARIQAALEAAGVRGAEVIESDLTNCEQQLEDLAKAEPDLFVVWGGDGTLRSAMTTVGKKTPNLLLLPGGTMNLLTKAVHGEKPWDKILTDVIASPKRVWLPAGRLNDDLFYCAMLAGAPARLAEAREAVRRGELVKAAAGARAALDTLQNLHLDATYRDGYSFGRHDLPTTSVIGVLVGPMTRGGEKMEIASLTDTTPGAALNVIWSTFISDWRSAPGISVVPATSLVITAEDGDDIPVIVDGESVQAGDKIRVEYVEEAAQCLTAAG